MSHSVSKEICENSHPTNIVAGSAEHVSPTRHHCLRTICRTARTERKFSRRQQFFVFFNSNPSFEARSRRHRRHHRRCFEKNETSPKKVSQPRWGGRRCCWSAPSAAWLSCKVLRLSMTRRRPEVSPTVFLRRFRKAGTKATCFGPRNCIELNEIQILKFILLKIFSSLTAV